jgi:hypothetical protein
MAKDNDKAISSAARRKIEKTLPPTFAALASADRAEFWNKLEQIKRAETPPATLAAQCEEMARQIDEFAPAVLGGHVVVIEQLKQRSDALRKLAATYHLISQAEDPHFLRQCQLLWLWETIGGKLGVTTRQLPRGPVIAYFQAAAEFVFGKTLGPEGAKKVVVRYRRDVSPALRVAFNAGLLRTVFGIPFDAEQQVQVSIDESKIFILRDGKLIDKDGNVVGGVG